MLTLQFIPYMEIDGLTSVKRISKLLKLVKSDRILLLEGKLKPHEEAELIRKTMEEIDHKFKGIEISNIYPESKEIAMFHKVKSRFISMILGDRKGFTIIGPASIIKEIKQDPEKIQLFTTDEPKKRK
ncbi:MAG: DUF2073 domain-containing protein [Nanoarchaeota archaeon]|nr:DUF2073 domain-containing protein [Nanoarchaeota archaeon]